VMVVAWVCVQLLPSSEYSYPATPTVSEPAQVNVAAAELLSASGTSIRFVSAGVVSRTSTVTMSVVDAPEAS
jgi:hypothetical protein